MAQSAGTMIGGIFAARRVIGFGKDIMDTFAGFEQGMADVKAVSGASGDDFERLSAKAKEMGSETSKTATEAAEGLKYLSLAGWNTEQVLAGIEPVLRLSEAGTMNLGRASDLATDSMAAMGIGVGDLMPYLDKVAQTGRKANTSVEQLMDAFVIAGGVFKTNNVPLEESAALLGILANRGFKGSEAGTAINAITSNITSGLGNPGKAMRKLSLSAFDAKGNFKGLEQVFREVKAKIDPMTDAQKAQYISMIAGKEHLKTFTGILDGLGNEYDSLKGSVSSADGALMDMAKTQMDTYSGAMNLLKAAVDGAKITIGSKLAPTIRKAATQLTALIPNLMAQAEKEYDAMTKSPVWQNADWIGKVKIAWDRLVSKPFSAWWQGTGKKEFEKVGKEIARSGKKILGGLLKEAFSFNGASSVLSAGVLAMPAMKAGKGIFGTVKVMKELASVGGGAAKGVSLLGPALGLLANPIGLAVAGIGALGLGFVAYRKHQEKARKEMINMGGALREAAESYQEVADKSALTKTLTDEYRSLDDAVKNNVGTAEELTAAQERMAELTQQLQDMFPQTLTNYDIERGKMLEKLGIIDQMNEAELALEKLRLEGVVAEKRAQQSKLEKEIGNIGDQIAKQEERVKAFAAERDAIDAAIPLFRRYEAEFQKINQMEFSEERTAKMQDLIKRANELGNTVGLHFGNIGLISGTSDDLFKKAEEVNKKIFNEISKQSEKTAELNTAKSSYEELYNAQKNIIEIDLGGTLEEQAKKFKDMSTEEQARFDAALVRINDINNRMSEMPTEHKINVDVVFNESRGTSNIPAEARQRLGMDYKTGLKLDEYADGGLANRPSIFAEEGPEMAIPINNKPRSHALLEETNRIMGHDTTSDLASQTNKLIKNHAVNNSETSIVYSPQIVVQGGAPGDVQKQVEQGSKQSFDDFSRWYKQMRQQERRLSFQ
ncbi:phage tail tape measure protein [Paenibacillaceae bacterium]|nr:phage tail tape measure protein [Paenibacillaceae bacterium]